MKVADNYVKEGKKVLVVVTNVEHGMELNRIGQEWFNLNCDFIIQSYIYVCMQISIQTFKLGSLIYILCIPYIKLNPFLVLECVELYM